MHVSNQTVEIEPEDMMSIYDAVTYIKRVIPGDRHEVMRRPARCNLEQRCRVKIHGCRVAIVDHSAKTFQMFLVDMYLSKFRTIRRRATKDSEKIIVIFSDSYTSPGAGRNSAFRE